MAWRVVHPEPMKALVWLVVGLSASACALDRIPRTASGRSCATPEDCPAMVCTCGNGSAVRHRGCVNHACQTTEDWCPRACEELGGWTPRDAGLTLCTDHPDCPGEPCRCGDGTTALDAQCGPAGECATATCQWGCRNNSGWADCIPSGQVCDNTRQDCCTGYCDETGHCRDGF